jgi:hypothetical protein
MKPMRNGTCGMFPKAAGSAALHRKGQAIEKTLAAQGYWSPFDTPLAISGSEHSMGKQQHQCRPSCKASGHHAAAEPDGGGQFQALRLNKLYFDSLIVR